MKETTAGTKSGTAEYFLSQLRPDGPPLSPSVGFFRLVKFDIQADYGIVEKSEKESTFIKERTYYMKKGTLLTIAAIATAFLLLAAITIYLTVNFNDAVFTSSEADSTAESDFRFETEPKQTDTSSSEAQKSPQNHFLIWVGDSRTVGMHDAVQDDCIYIGASGEGYDWFAASGESEMRAALKDHPDAPVILNLGVNDYDNMDRYLTRYRSLVKELPDTRFYFMSINPVEPTLCKNITNEQISDFNTHLKEAFPDSYIDTFTYIMVNEISTFDGVHYSEEAYQTLHDFVVQYLTET